MRNKLIKSIFLGALLLTYGLLFYFLINLKLNSDFTSFYGSTLAYTQGMNPYQGVTSSFLPHSIDVPVDLNPPFFLELFAPFSHLTFITASILWFFISLILGGVGAVLSFFIFSSPTMFKKYWCNLLLLYLAMYPTIMNISFGQLGNFLLFFIVLGYYFFSHNKKDYLAGFFWGIVVAVKLFPALLFFFVLVQRWYKVFWAMLVTASFASLIPLFTHGFQIYVLYFKTLKNVLWYGNSWNASIYGFLYRLFINVDTQQNFLPIKIIYLFIFIALLSWYIKKLHYFQKIAQPHYAFCLTIIMMLLLSPFGWLYYFPLLVMPLILIHKALSSTLLASGAKNPKICINESAPTLNIREEKKKIFFGNNVRGKSLYNLWIIGLFLICFPQGNIQARYMGLFIYKITVYSVFFYGLLLLVYLLNTTCRFAPYGQAPHAHSTCLFPAKIVLSLGLSVVLIILLMHFYLILL